MKNCLWAMAFSIASTLPAQAETPQPVQQNNSNAVWFENWVGLKNATMTISQPDGEIVSLYTAAGTPVFDLAGKEAVDGVYRYEITAATEEEIKVKNKLNNGRGDAERDTAAKPFYMSGIFHVQRGVIVVPEKIEEKKE